MIILATVNFNTFKILEFEQKKLFLNIWILGSKYSFYMHRTTLMSKINLNIFFPMIFLS